MEILPLPSLPVNPPLPAPALERPPPPTTLDRSERIPRGSGPAAFIPRRFPQPAISPAQAKARQVCPAPRPAPQCPAGRR